VSLPFCPDQRVNPFFFGASEHDILWQFLFTHSASTVTATVNQGVAGGAMLLTQANAVSGQLAVQRNRGGLASAILAAFNGKRQCIHNLWQNKTKNTVRMFITSL